MHTPVTLKTGTSQLSGAAIESDTFPSVYLPQRPHMKISDQLLLSQLVVTIFPKIITSEISEQYPSYSLSFASNFMPDTCSEQLILSGRVFLYHLIAGMDVCVSQGVPTGVNEKQLSDKTGE